MYLTAGQHEEEYRRQLGRYGVINDLALRPVRSLSGGQKSRVVMALMSMIRYTPRILLKLLNRTRKFKWL